MWLNLATKPLSQLQPVLSFDGLNIMKHVFSDSNLINMLLSILSEVKQARGAKQIFQVFRIVGRQVKLKRLSY